MLIVGSWNVVLGSTGPGTDMTSLLPDCTIVFGPDPMFEPPLIENAWMVEFAGMGTETWKFRMLFSVAPLPRSDDWLVGALVSETLKFPFWYTWSTATEVIVWVLA